ncbi:MAG TPA: trehalose-phosphatase [Myxococcales bacterium]|nr:trehalose-phosphatase [Myxococcales bacterium]
MRNSEVGRPGAVRPLWSEADALRERIADAPALFGFFSFDTALAQRATHGHLRTNPAARAALIRLCAAPNTRGAVMSGRRIETLQRRLRLHRLGYVGVHGAEVENFGLRLVTEPDLDSAEQAVARLRKACARTAALQAAGIALEDRVWALVLHLRLATLGDQIAAAEEFGRLAAAEGLQLRRGSEMVEAYALGASFGRAALGLLAGLRAALPVYVGAGDNDEEGFVAVQRFGGITVHVGPPPRMGTAARWHVADSREVIRLIHWLADARRCRR